MNYYKKVLSIVFIFFILFLDGNIFLYYKYEGDLNKIFLFSIVGLFVFSVVLIWFARGISISLMQYINDLKRATEVKSNFIAMVSHELRTPLTAIKEGVALLADEVAGPVNKEQKDFLGIIKRNVDRLMHLITNVLDFQQLDSGAVALNIKEVNINTVIENVKTVLFVLAKEKGLDFTIDLSSNLPLIKFDKDKIVHVFTILVNNAIKFTEKGSVKITSAIRKERPGMILVSVKDTGTGIAMENLDQLFEKFIQFGKLAERRGGSGLSLAIAKEIINAHRGRMWAESELGKGTTFYFELPIK
jgi:signal transduction histidine kinase